MAALPPVPFKVKALAPYTPSSATELALVVGQIYEVTNTDGKGIWVQSSVNGVVGWFPFNYTEVISSKSAPSAPASSVPAANASSDASSATVLKKKPKKEKRNRPKKPGPPLRSHVEKNKKNHPVTLNVQVVRAKLAIPEADIPKIDTTAFLFVRDILGDEEGRKFEGTNTVKKTAEPHWNEAFKLVIEDPERTTLVVRVCSGKEYNRKKLIGEFQILLRGSHRGDFEGDGQYKWHYLCKDALKETPKKEGAPGKVLLFIQYCDTRETGKPTDFKRLGHIGWSASGGFDLNNIPPEWKEMFRQTGLTKAALQADQNLAKEVFNIMEQADGGSSGGMPAAPPMPTMSSSMSSAMASGGGPPPPPAPKLTTPSAPKPPPSRPSVSHQEHQQEEYQEEYQEEQPEESSNSLLAAIRKGTSLRNVEVQERPAFEEEEAAGGAGLSGLLKKAMAGRLIAAGGDDDWSEEEPDDDDWD